MKAILRKILCTASALIMVLSLLTVSAYAASSPKISKSNVELPIGYGITLTVSGANEKITWSSENSDVAEIKSSEGNSARIIGKNTGTAYVYAKTGKTTLKCKVTVKKSFITENNSNIELRTGASGAVTLTVKGSKDIAMINSDQSVCTTSWGKWNSDSIRITITAKKAGTAKIKVYAKGYSGSTAKTITVKVGSELRSSDTSDMEDEVIQLVNTEREKKGLEELSKDATLEKIADIRAQEVTESFSHLRPDGNACFTAFEDMGIVNVYMGENLAMGQTSASKVMDAWMKSSGHKANILSSEYSRVGVACVESGGLYYWVQVFSGEY